jgi:hypothetical protein
VSLTTRCNHCTTPTNTCRWKAGIVGHGETNTKTGALSPCIECDEKACGPAFKVCAGAYRRTAGLYSEIQRAEDELCRTVDVGPGALENPHPYTYQASTAAATR